MVDWIGKYGLSPMIYLIEVGLLGFLILRGHARRLISILLYLASLLALDGIARPYVWARYGLSSREYAYFFWVSDVVLALAAFLLVCALFHRACPQERRQEMWQHLRRLLTFVFILVVGISLFSLHRNYDNLFSVFIIEFQQNLYFTCLMLLTLLYFLMQKFEIADDELTLLVSGMGIQFAGPAASLALLHLAPDQGISRFLATYLGPMCTLGMLLIWFYAVAYPPKAVTVPGLGSNASKLAEATAREA